jgi:hypothetical protein
VVRCIKKEAFAEKLFLPTPRAPSATKLILGIFTVESGEQQRAMESSERITKAAPRKLENLCVAYQAKNLRAAKGCYPHRARKEIFIYRKNKRAVQIERRERKRDKRVETYIIL